MKPLNATEIDHLLTHSKHLEGAVFQGFLGTEKELALKFWKNQIFYLLINFQGAVPFFVFLDSKERLLQKFQNRKKLTKPLFLFLKTHFMGESLICFERSQDYGRMIHLQFGDEKTITLRMFPGGANLSAQAHGKEVFLFKPHALKKMDQDYKPKEIRSPDVILDQALDFFSKTLKAETAQDGVNQRALSQIDHAIQVLNRGDHKKLAEALEKNQALSKDLQKLYKENKSRQENIDEAYKKHRSAQAQILRLESRREQILKAKRRSPGPSDSQKKTGSRPSSRIFWPSENLRALCGKSAHENLLLLRKAKPWQIWLHLKDHPSGHMIIERPKGYKLKDEELRKCAFFLFEKAAPKKLLQSVNLKFEVVFTEVKFVKPIKGAKAGLVRYSREESRLYCWQSNKAL